MSKNYIVKITCKNCKDINYHTLEKGQNVKGYMAQTKCEVCDCFLDADSEEEEQEEEQEESKED